jgi:hypothetical protein
MVYGGPGVERAMKLQEIILRALSGEWTWIHAADVLGVDPRSLRRWRARYESGEALALYDRRHQTSPRKTPIDQLERVVRLYRDAYAGFNVRHFHECATRDHDVALSYTVVRLALQEAGLVRKRRARGRHRRRREPRHRFGELLHLDGSPHPWLALCPTQRLTLIAVLDDATKRLLYAQLWPAETLVAVMSALAAVVRAFGLPQALYTDRASWAFHTPKARGPLSREHLTHVGRALARLGIEHIGAYSPQARGRSERLNRTLQDRLVNELRLAGITTRDAANVYLRECFIPDYDARFTCPPVNPASAFVPLGALDLDHVFCEEEERVVTADNVVTFDGVALQIAKQPDRPSCAGLHVLVRRHLDRSYTVWRGPRCLGHFSALGQDVAISSNDAVDARFRPAGGTLPRLRDVTRRPRRRSSPRLPAGPAARPDRSHVKTR